MPRDENANGDGAAANPDPAVFEAAFVIDDADDSTAPSRVATPSLAGKETKAGDAGKGTEQAGAGGPVNGATDAAATGDNGEPNKPAADNAANAASAAAPVASELPPEVRARLRKLDKLEKTYPGLRGPTRK